MRRIAANTISKNKRGVYFANDNQVGSANVSEPDYAELHALYRSEYEKFLTDTNTEIEKRTRRVLRWESILVRKLLSK